MFCPHCKSKSTTVEKTATDADVMRWHACSCGARWRSLARLIRGSLTIAIGATGNLPVAHRQPTGRPHIAANSRFEGPPTTGSVNEINDLRVGLGDSSARGEGLGGVPGSGSLFPESDPNPSQPSGSGSLERSSKRSPRALVETEAFRTFWSDQLRKVAKANALKAWHRQGCEGIAEVVLRGWRAQLPVMRARELEHVPHPASWINARRWEDIVESPKGPAPGSAAPASPYCAWHQDGAKSRIPSRFPSETCPDCKRHSARAGNRQSEPMALDLPAWAQVGNG